VNPTNSANNQAIFAIRSTGADSRLSIHLNTQNNEVGIYNNEDGFVSASLAVPINSWSHLAFVIGPSSTQVFLNGVYSVTIAADLDETKIGSAIAIGGPNDPIYTIEYFTGKIDEVRIWNDERTASEILNNYQCDVANSTNLVANYIFSDGVGSPTATDVTGNGHNGTLSNMNTNIDWIVRNKACPVCDLEMTDIVTVNVLLAKVGTENSTLCFGESIVVNGITYDASNLTGTEIFNNVGPYMCDSIVTINITVLPLKSSVITQTICSGESILVNGNTYNTSVAGAIEVVSNVGPQNCDSTITINLTVLPAKVGIENSTLCFGGSTVINGTTYDGSNLIGTETFNNVGS